MQKSFIFCTTAREGFHAFLDAGINPALADVSFLSHTHRHMFHIKATIEVFHDDRELEFIQVKRYIENAIDTNQISINNQSCEMICDVLYELLTTKYGTAREYRIEVNEDNENGAINEYDAQ